MYQQRKCPIFVRFWECWCFIWRCFFPVSILKLIKELPKIFRYIWSSTAHKHIHHLSNTASKLLRALTKIRKFLSQEQTKHLSSKVYIMSTSKYCPLIWMFCGKTENKTIKKIHRAQTHSPINPPWIIL